MLDFFAAHDALLEAIAQVRRDEASLTPSHMLVHLELVPNATAAKVLRLYQPKRLSVKPAVGPRKQPLSWRRATVACADYAEARLRN